LISSPFVKSATLTRIHICNFQFYWVEKHLGKHWLERIIIAKDKTMANGHLLIDDRPNISGIDSTCYLYEILWSLMI